MQAQSGLKSSLGASGCWRDESRKEGYFGGLTRLGRGSSTQGMEVVAQTTPGCRVDSTLQGRQRNTRRGGGGRRGRGAGVQADDRARTRRQRDRVVHLVGRTWGQMGSSRQANGETRREFVWAL